MATIHRRQFSKYLTGAALGATTGLLPQAWANDASMMRIVVPFGPGGGGDVLARLFADKLGPALGRTIIVDNKPGGSTTIGTDYVAKAKPDGNTVLLTVPLIIQTYFLFKKLPYDPFADLTPVVDLVRSPLWVAVNTQRSTATNLAGLIEEAKAHPKEHIYGSIGNGSSSHILGSHLNKVGQVDMLHVPYKGSSQVSLALASGEITMTILDLVTLGPLLTTGKVRLIGVTGTERSPLTPDISTLQEQGYPGFELPTWAGFFVPKGTPQDAIQKLHDASVAVMQLPQVQPRLKDLGYVAGGHSAADFQKQLEQERVRWGRLIRDSHIEM